MGCRPITFLSDYGYEDEFAGLCRAVIARIAPGAAVIDLTHGIPRGAVRRGALVLADALPFAPAGVHLAVVDPGVGSSRRAVAVRVPTEDRVLVGPDNGLLSRAIEALGGAVEAVDVGRSPLGLTPRSGTFHGRDLFAPLAAHIASGVELAAAGDPIAPGSLAGLELPHAMVQHGRAVAHVLVVDGYGNAALDLRAEDLEAMGLRPGSSVEVEAPGRRREAGVAVTFADVDAGELLLYEDSRRALALAVNGGDAASELGIAVDDEVVIRAVE